MDTTTAGNYGQRKRKDYSYAHKKWALNGKATSEKVKEKKSRKRLMAVNMNEKVQKRKAVEGLMLLGEQLPRYVE
jgi:hypothetical protein